MAQAALARGEGKERGKTSRIFLLKTPATPSDPYEHYFLSRGYESSFVPVLETELVTENLDHVKNLFASGAAGEKYGGMIFTSQRAVEGFAFAMRDEGVRCATEDVLLRASRPFILYAIGPATYNAVKAVQEAQLPHAEVQGHDAGTGDKLAEIIVGHYNGLFSQGGRAENKEKLPLLFLEGEKHRDVIPKTLMSPELPASQRIGVEELVVYRTVELESFETGFMRAVREVHFEDKGGEHEDRAFVWICIFSPAGCDIVIETLQNLVRLTPPEEREGETSESGKPTASNTLPRNCYLADIGPTTRDHLRSRFGVEPDVCAERPSPEGLGSAIDAYMERKKESRNQSTRG